MSQEQPSITTNSSHLEGLASSLSTFSLKSVVSPALYEYSSLLGEASEQLSSVVPRASLGPKGTSLILDNLVVDNHIAMRLVLAAKEQQQKYGDGAKLVVLIAQEHLKGAKDLVRTGLSIREIIDGYMEATNKMGEILEALVEDGSQTMNVRDKEQVLLRMKARLCGELHGLEDVWTTNIADACIQVCPKDPLLFNANHVRVAAQKNKSKGSFTNMKGIILNGDSCVGSIRAIEKGKVLVVNTTPTETNPIHKPENHEAVKKLISRSGAKVIVSGGGVRDAILDFCNDKGIMVLRIASHHELECFCVTTGSTSFSLEYDLHPHLSNYVGQVDSIVASTTMVTIKRQKSTVKTLLLGLGKDISEEELQTAVVKVANTYKALCQGHTKIVPGAGFTEREIAKQLKDFSCSKQNGCSAAITKYAQSLEVIPKQLAQKADLDLWDLYTTKYQALKCVGDAVCLILRTFQEPQSIFGRVMLPALSLVKQACREYNPIRQTEITEFDDIFKTSLAVLCSSEGTDFYLSKDCKLHSRHNLSKDLYWSKDTKLLPNILQCDCTYDIDLPYIIMRSHKVKDMITYEGESIEKGCKNGYCDGNGYTTMSRFSAREFFDPITGEEIASIVLLGRKMLCLQRSDLQMTWCKGDIDKQTKEVLCYIRIIMFEIYMCEAVERERVLVVPKCVSGVQKAFLPGKYPVKWYAKYTDGPLVPNEELEIDVLRVKKCEECEELETDETVKNLVKCLSKVTKTNPNILKVYSCVDTPDSRKDFYEFFIERFGITLSAFIQKEGKLSTQETIKLMRGILNGLKALHDNEVFIGNLKVDDIFVDEELNVKIAPINQHRRFSSTPSAFNMYDSEPSSPSSHLSSNAAARDMVSAGEIMFFCLMGNTYNGESVYSEDMRKKKTNIGVDAFDLLEKLLETEISASEASSHSSFWTMQKKMDFIRAVKEHTPNNKFKQTLEGIKASILGYNIHSWKPKFPTKFINLMEDEKFRKKVGNPQDGNSYTSYTYTETSIYGLFQIARNFLSHEEEITKLAKEDQDLQVDKDLQNMLSGFGVFMMRQFPNLITESHKALKESLKNHPKFIRYYS